jgi:hypothetical protein
VNPGVARPVFGIAQWRQQTEGRDEGLAEAEEAPEEAGAEDAQGAPRRETRRREAASQQCLTARVSAAARSLPSQAPCSVAVSSQHDEECEKEPELHLWRLRQFRSLGFDDDTARVLAAEGVDWHEAERLIRQRGCPLETATKILI